MNRSHIPDRLKAGLQPTRLHSVLAVLCVLSVLLPAQEPAAKKKGISVGEPPADLSPEAELASFKVLDGFSVNLFASEKDGIPNALVIRWDERGRLWCLQTSSYPQPAPGEIVDDKIVILEDTDHDGRADKTTVFADGLRMPMGMELGVPGELYVGEGEKLWLFKDTNGDDRVDEKEIVFSGFGTGDAHQNLNSFVWSPDGALVMHQGLHCYSRVATAHGVKQLYGAGFWHFWPRSRRLEPYPTGMPQNAWGTAFDKWGQPIMVAGAAGMYWARPMEISVPEVEDPQTGERDTFRLTRFMLPSSGQIIKTEGLRKFCGVDIVGNSHWPDAMQDEVISGGFFENAVFRYKIIDDKDNPSGYEAIEQPPLITSDNVAFRPVDVRFGPEGALYIADWFNPIIGHYQASFRHPNRDKTHGRIWRVVARGRRLASESVFSGQYSVGQRVDSKAKEQRIKVHSPAGSQSVSKLVMSAASFGGRWSDYQARRLLSSASWEQVSHAIDDVADQWKWMGFKHPVYPRFEVFKIQSRESCEVPLSSRTTNALSSDDPRVRTSAVHAIGEWAGELSGALSSLGIAITDESPRVRLEAIVAAAKVKSPDAIRVALKALDKPMDSFLDRALWLAIHATAPQWKPLLVTNGKSPSLFDSLPPKHLAYLVEKEGSAEILGVARTLLEQEGGTLNDAVKRALSAALVRKGGPGDMLRALKLGQKDQGILDDLAEAAAQRGFKAPAGSLPLMRALLESGTDGQRVALCRLAAAWGVKDLKRSVEALADASSSQAVAANIRVAAIAALGKLGADATWIQPMIVNARESWPVRIAALGALAETRPADAGSSAVEAFSSIVEADTMRQWLAPLLPRDAAVKSLASALKAKPCTADAAKLAIRVLAATGRSEPELSAVLGGIIGVSNSVPSYDPTWVSALAAEVKAKGAPAKGRAVFTSPLVNCTACHSIGKQGGTIGPELDAVGRGVPLELLIEAVVWPNRQIKEGYIATTLLTKDGRRMQGYKISDANGELQLRDFLSGTVSRFATGEIKERQDAGSLMPEGLIMNMTREELRNLIAYLASLGRP
ncbi:MAG: HEAT repeat domain-containing protein [Verrucomicrobiaceae bacterium]|nr:HEAT repeat domain-containing protein [Verrucomicrobiaceae bacterium]